MSPSARLVGFVLDALRYALPLAHVERVVRAVEITPLPHAPEVIMGIINVQGTIVAVADLRKRFRLPTREVGVDDHIVIAQTSARRLALVVDTVSGVVECAEQDIVPVTDVMPGVDYVEGIVKLADGIVLIHDIDTFLGVQEQEKLDLALTNV